MRMAEPRVGSRPKRMNRSCLRGRRMGDGSTTPGGRPDGRDIWRMPADGGVPERLTHGAGGAFACESADGKSLLFQPKDADSPLMTMALAGGQARQLIACVKNSAFGVGPRGVYYVPCDLTPDPPLYVLDPKTGRTARLGRLDGLTDAPAGAQCVARRQHSHLPQAGALTRRPDVDRELQVSRGVPPQWRQTVVWTHRVGLRISGSDFQRRGTRRAHRVRRSRTAEMVGLLLDALDVLLVSYSFWPAAERRRRRAADRALGAVMAATRETPLTAGEPDYRAADEAAISRWRGLACNNHETTGERQGARFTTKLPLKGNLGPDAIL